LLKVALNIIKLTNQPNNKNVDIKFRAQDVFLE
jgi:hypothetical protein